MIDCGVAGLIHIRGPTSEIARDHLENGLSHHHAPSVIRWVNGDQALGVDSERGQALPGRLPSATQRGQENRPHYPGADTAMLGQDSVATRLRRLEDIMVLEVRLQ